MDALYSFQHLVATEHAATGNDSNGSVANTTQVIGNTKGHLTTTAIAKQHQFMA
jgi:hypothetical protein